MCNYYELEIGMSEAQASGNVSKQYQVGTADDLGDRAIGACGLENLDNSPEQPLTTWYAENFEGNNICGSNVGGNPPSGPAG
jgi:hypothetical protein